MDLYKIKNKLQNGKSIYDIRLNVVYYARVSTDKNEQTLSLDNQVKYFENFIKSNKNWTFKGGYVDEGESGTSVKKRHNFLKMISDAKEGKFDLIITKEISRFSRNTLDSIKYTQMLLNYGVGVFFQTDNINTLLPDSELRLTIMAGIAQDEVRRISERVKFGLKQSVKDGKMLGNAPFGYTKKNGILQIKDSEAKIVKKIFNYYVSGIGIRHISKKLADEGYLNSNSNPFTFSSIRSILSNPKYKGYYCANKYYSVDFKYGKKLKADKNDWILKKDENVPEIVSEKTWNKANEILNERSTHFKNNLSSYSNRYFFSGKIICAHHNASYHRVMYNKTEAYRCSHSRFGCESVSIYKREINNIMNDIFSKIFDNKKVIAKYFKKISKSSDNAKKIKELTLKKDKLFELVAGGFISNDDFKAKNDELTLKIDKLNEKEIKFNENAFLNDNFDNYKNTDYIKLEKVIVKNSGKYSAQLDIHLLIGKGKIRCISLHETGISQAQVSRLEKSAIDRMRKYV